MRKGRDSLASVVRQKFGKDPKMGMRAYIFYAKNLKTIKILHYTVTGYEMYVKWFDDYKTMKPEFSKMKTTHTITRSQLLLLLNGAVRPKLKID